ncbi:hypothetical protein JHK87_007424 [Glycine soja]|nr:hypothetical protein JHK87_007424 [Glycine soja]
MPYVNNDVYLQLAKLDYSNCQAVHCVEWEKNPKALEQEKREEELLEILLTNLDYLGFQMFRSHGQEFSHYLNQAASLVITFSRIPYRLKIVATAASVQPASLPLTLNQTYKNLCNWCSKIPLMACTPMSRIDSSQWSRAFTMEHIVTQRP